VKINQRPGHLNAVAGADVGLKSGCRAIARIGRNARCSVLQVADFAEFAAVGDDAAHGDDRACWECADLRNGEGLGEKKEG